MALSIDQAEQLKTLEFSLPDSRLEKHQQVWWFKDTGPFEGEQYCAGGRLSSNAPASISPVLQKHGLWLPTIPELLLWLELRKFSLDIKTNPNTELSHITAQHSAGHKYQARAETIETALFLVIIQILESRTASNFSLKPKKLPAKFLELQEGLEGPFGLEFNLILKRSGTGIAQRTAKKVEQRLEAASLSYNSSGRKPYLTRHDPTEVIIELPNDLQVNDIQKMYDC